MTSEVSISDLRDTILRDPNAILNDREVMRALVSADDAAKGDNIVDLKTAVVQRLEERLDQLEGHHKTILSAAYDNIASTNHLHRAVLAALEPNSFAEFLEFLDGGLADVLNVTMAKLCMETAHVTERDIPALREEFGKGVVFLREGEVDHYITLGREVEPRLITLRQIKRGITKIHDEHADHIRSEALLKLDLGTGNRVGLLALSSRDTDQFSPAMGTDLLVFFGGVFERILQRWLAHE